ncbi:hypothetical protein DFR49_0211 [Hephaestia caeni]|uniref:Uncharacterized protein n=1 Tax=Hephaestia caeni TaxID=645617 RepID=A0A397P9T8_9SPHN|nr:hypothetical protein DFR49_0211 [Hephaestia caeni]
MSNALDVYLTLQNACAHFQFAMLGLGDTVLAIAICKRADLRGLPTQRPCFTLRQVAIVSPAIDAVTGLAKFASDRRVGRADTHIDYATRNVAVAWRGSRRDLSMHSERHSQKKHRCYSQSHSVLRSRYEDSACPNELMLNCGEAVVRFAAKAGEHHCVGVAMNALVLWQRKGKRAFEAEQEAREQSR